MANSTVNKSVPHIRELEGFADTLARLEMNVAIFSAEGEPLLMRESGLFVSDEYKLSHLCLRIAEESVRQLSLASERVVRVEELHRILGANLQVRKDVHYVIMVDLGPFDENEQELLDRKELIGSEMLSMFCEKMEIENCSDNQIEDLSNELAKMYEEIVLLHRMSAQMKLTEPSSHYLQMACDNLTDIIRVEGIAVFMKKAVLGEWKLQLSAGSGIVDINEDFVGSLYERLVKEISCGREALLDSEIDSPFTYQWPVDVRNIIAVPMFRRDNANAHDDEFSISESITGMMVAINVIDKQDFDTTDVKLFNSVAGGCAVFIENDRLFTDLKELFIGSLRALTNSIDAKDQYTRGHSERVAFISRWIAERMTGENRLSDQEINRVYLAGLLHDIGKVGVSETILRKTERLTDDEYQAIRKHPAIGAGILREIKQMSEIVPGVLCHHERLDGKGYPCGVTAKDIPMIGRIVQLADSFDAMTTKRTYRDALSIEEAIEEIKKNIDTQFDGNVVKTFLESDVYHLWEMLQMRPDQRMATYGEFVDYGTQAVGALLR